jgi:hypothetical protein
MLEMAGFDRVKFIPEKLYVYNMENPCSDSRLRINQQIAYAKYIAGMKPYSRVKTFE